MKVKAGKNKTRKTARIRKDKPGKGKTENNSKRKNRGRNKWVCT